MFSKNNQSADISSTRLASDMLYRRDSKLPFRCFFRQDNKHTPRMSNAADNTATNDPRIITAIEQPSLSSACFLPFGSFVGSSK